MWFFFAFFFVSFCQHLFCLSEKVCQVSKLSHSFKELKTSLLVANSTDTVEMCLTVNCSPSFLTALSRLAYNGVLADNLDTYGTRFVGLSAYIHTAKLRFFLHGTPVL